MSSVAVVIVNSRSVSHKDWVDRAISSVKSQSYPVELIVYNNTSRTLTVGRCRNEAVKQVSADTEWVLFVDDDDYIAPDYVQMQLQFALSVQKEFPELIGVTSCSTYFNDEQVAPVMKAPIGMWKREYLLENPFLEYLTKGEDVELVDRVMKQRKYFVQCAWNYGYYYRMHNDQNSGKKILKLTDKINELNLTTANRRLIGVSK